jgi:hypothetical protein
MSPGGMQPERVFESYPISPLHPQGLGDDMEQGEERRRGVSPLLILNAHRPLRTPIPLDIGAKQRVPSFLNPLGTLK